MAIDNVGDFVNELESYDEWQLISVGIKHGKPCLFIYGGDGDTIVGCISLPSHKTIYE